MRDGGFPARRWGCSSQRSISSTRDPLQLIGLGTGRLGRCARAARHSLPPGARADGGRGRRRGGGHAGQVPVRLPGADRRRRGHQAPPGRAIGRSRARWSPGADSRPDLSGCWPRDADRHACAVSDGHLVAESRRYHPGQQGRRGSGPVRRSHHQRLRSVAQPVERAGQHQPVGRRHHGAVQRSRGRGRLATCRNPPLCRGRVGRALACRSPRRPARPADRRAARRGHLFRATHACPRAVPLSGAGSRRAAGPAAARVGRRVRRPVSPLLRERVLGLHDRLELRRRGRAESRRRRPADGARPCPGRDPALGCGRIPAVGCGSGDPGLAHLAVRAAGPRLRLDGRTDPDR